MSLTLRKKTETGYLCWCEPDQLEREPEGMYWRKVMGLDSLKNSLSSSRLVHFHSTQKLIDLLPGDRLSNSGGNILLFWDVIEGEHVEIWCAEISLERRKGPEIWGNIERSHAVMTVDPLLHHYKVLHSVSVTLWTPSLLFNLLILCLFYLYYITESNNFSSLICLRNLPTVSFPFHAKFIEILI